MDYETDADAYSLGIVRAVNPKSRIPAIVLAFRVLVPNAYDNGMALAYTLKGLPMPSVADMKAALAQERLDIQTLFPVFRSAMVRQMGPQANTLVMFTATLAALAARPDTPGRALVHEWAQLQLDSYRLIAPRQTAEGERMARALLSPP